MNERKRGIGLSGALCIFIGLAGAATGPAFGEARLFFALPGQQASVPTTGSYTIEMDPVTSGSSRSEVR